MNFWASWCVSCRDEHPVLTGDEVKKMAALPNVQFLGINHKDTAANATGFLQKMGTFPYPSGVDGDGRLALEFGVYGMPETFFINQEGVIAAKHIGALNLDILMEKIKVAAQYKAKGKSDE